MQNTNKKKHGGVNISDFLSRKAKEKKVVMKPIQPVITKDALLKTQKPPKKVEAVKDDTKLISKDKGIVKGKKKALTDLENKEMTDDLRGMQNPQKYLAFLNWVAMPEMNRNPRTQKEIAEQLGVSENTITSWKQRPRYNDTLLKVVRSQWSDKIGQAVQALYVNLLKNGDAKEFMAFMQVIAKFNPKVLVSDETPQENKYDPARIDKLTKALKDVGYESIVGQNKKILDDFANLLDDEDDLSDIEN